MYGEINYLNKTIFKTHISSEDENFYYTTFGTFFKKSMGWVVDKKFKLKLLKDDLT